MKRATLLLISSLHFFVAGCDSSPSVNLEGIWSTSLTLGIDESFEIADYGCFAGCPVAAYERLRESLDDSANDARPFRELMLEAWAYAGETLRENLTDSGLTRLEALGTIDEDRLNCRPQGFVAQITNPIPMEITQLDDRVMIKYELWDVERTIFIDGRGHPDDLKPTPYGHSIGYYDNDSLVVETTGVAPSRLSVNFGGGGHSESIETTERYTRSENGNLLRMELTIEDPEMLRTPLVYEKVWRYTPDIQLFEYECILPDETGDA